MMCHLFLCVLQHDTQVKWYLFSYADVMPHTRIRKEARGSDVMYFLFVPIHTVILPRRSWPVLFTMQRQENSSLLIVPKMYVLCFSDRKKLLPRPTAFDFFGWKTKNWIIFFIDIDYFRSRGGKCSRDRMLVRIARSARSRGKDAFETASAS